MTRFDGLYYPYIHFRDDSWLKTAALYWDSMARIVPYDYPLNDSDSVRVLKDELGFIVDEHPTDRDARGAASEFIPELAKKAGRVGTEFRVREFEVKTGQELGYIYCEKMNLDAIRFLEENGLARRTRFGDPMWIGMHPDVARYYMTLLADTMAFRSRRLPVTNDVLGQSAAGASATGLVSRLVKFGDPEEAASTGRALSLVFELVVPRGLANVPASAIAKFVSKYADEKRAFQGHLQKLIATARAGARQNDPEALAHEVISLYNRTIKQDMKDLKKRLRDIRIDCAKTAFRNQVKLWALGATWGVIRPEATPVSPNRVALMSIATAAQAWDDVDKSRKSIKEARSRSAEVSFLLRAQRSLGKSGPQAELFSKLKRAHSDRSQIVTLNL